MDDYTTRLNDFVYHGNGRFVDPERVSAVEILGLDKAKELYAKYDGKLPTRLINDLRTYAVTSYLCGK